MEKGGITSWSLVSHENCISFQVTILMNLLQSCGHTIPIWNALSLHYSWFYVQCYRLIAFRWFCARLGCATEWREIEREDERARERESETRRGETWKKHGEMRGGATGKSEIECECDKFTQWKMYVCRYSRVLLHSNVCILFEIIVKYCDWPR